LSKKAEAGKPLGSGGPGYTIPAEIKPGHLHKKGVLAAARQGDQANPSRASSGSQFYIVVGKTYGDDGLNQIEQKIQQNINVSRIRTFMMLPQNQKLRDEVDKYQQERNFPKLDSIQAMVIAKIDSMHKDEPAFKYTPEQREIYKTIGGTPFLDMTYTVFGEVVEGMDVVEKIANVPALQGDRPEQDVKIESMKVVK
jgi:cyclophilin family peptidyl-prolyl cis-trans isomerase